jgi:hypothetical protein
MGVKEEKKLQDAFLYIRQTFFPRWDKTRKWIVILDRNLPSQGLCSEEKRQITIDHIDKDEDQLLLTLIHEICHTNLSGHGKSWQERMLQK